MHGSATLVPVSPLASHRPCLYRIMNRAVHAAVASARQAFVDGHEICTAAGIMSVRLLSLLCALSPAVASEAGSGSGSGSGDQGSGSGSGLSAQLVTWSFVVSGTLATICTEANLNYLKTYHASDFSTAGAAVTASMIDIQCTAASVNLAFTVTIPAGSSIDGSVVHKQVTTNYASQAAANAFLATVVLPSSGGSLTVTSTPR